MVSKLVRFTVAPGTAAPFGEALTRLEARSKNEEACIHYAAFQVADAPDQFVVIESWADMDGFESHRKACHTVEFKNLCGEMILEKSSTSLWPAGRFRRGTS